MARHVVPPRWKKGESGNPKGRPRMLVTTFIDDAEKAGIKSVMPQDVVAAYSKLFNTSDAELEKIRDDKNAPILLKIAARGLLDKKSGRSAVELMLNRAHGTPKSNDNQAPAGPMIWNETKTYDKSDKK